MIWNDNDETDMFLNEERRWLFEWWLFLVNGGEHIIQMCS